MKGERKMEEEEEEEEEEEKEVRSGGYLSWQLSHSLEPALLSEGLLGDSHFLQVTHTQERRKHKEMIKSIDALPLKEKTQLTPEESSFLASSLASFGLRLSE